jgi:hypothetical protein
MKKVLTLLTVAMVAASLSGCCCRRLCPWLDRGAYCGPTATPFAPLAATVPAVMPSYQPQYATPLAATAPNPCCTTWDPCQGQVMSYGYPTAAPANCCPTAAVEPGCAYVEPACGEPYFGGMSYGPSLMSGCATCGTGYTGAITVPSPEVVMPGPAE